MQTKIFFAGPFQGNALAWAMGNITAAWRYKGPADPSWKSARDGGLAVL